MFRRNSFGKAGSKEFRVLAVHKEASCSAIATIRFCCSSPGSPIERPENFLTKKLGRTVLGNLTERTSSLNVIQARIQVVSYNFLNQTTCSLACFLDNATSLINPF